MRRRARAVLAAGAAVVLGASWQIAAAQAPPLPLSQWHHSEWSFEGAPFVTAAETMLQSSDGYLWIGAGRAMVRFDGSRFTVFDSTNTPAFRFEAADGLTPAFVDQRGVLWIRGLDRALFTYQNGRFTRETVDDAGAGARGRPYINPSAVIDGAGRVWWCDRTVVTVHGGRPAPAILPAAMSDSGVLTMVPDTGSGIWFGTSSEGLWHVTSGGVEHFPFSDGAILPLLQSSDGTVWASSRGRKARLWRLKDGRFEQMSLGDDASPAMHVQRVLEAPDHSIWVATHGLGVLRWRDGAFERLDVTNGLSSSNVHALWIGVDETVWLTTDAGLERLRPSAFVPVDQRAGSTFRSAALFAPDDHGGFWSMASASDTLYFLDGGVVRGKNQRPVRLAFLPNAGEAYKLLGSAKDGGVWIGPNTGGLIRQRRSGAERMAASVGLPSARILQALQTHDGAIWTKAFNREMGRVSGNRYRRLSPFDNDRVETSAMFADRRGRVWVANEAGTELAALAGDSVVFRITMPTTLPPFESFTWEGGDTLWMSTAQSLRRLIGTRISEVPVADAATFLLPQREMEIGAGQLWLASRGGIVRFPLARIHAAADGGTTPVRGSRVNSLDGIAKPQTPSRTDNAVIRLPDDRALFATPGGYVITNASYRYDSDISPIPHVEEMTVDGRLVPADSGFGIPPAPDRVAIHYTATSLSLPERVQIAYMLEGADRAWVDGSSAPRVATYTQLRPGSYRFRVRAWNADGVVDTIEAVRSFRVLRAWYQSYWFLALCTLLLTALGYVVALAMQRDRARRAGERAEARFKAVLDERARIARELHDTLLQGFTGITLHLETVRGQLVQRRDPSAEDLATILKHADGTLREAREMVWDIRSPELDGGLMHAIEADSRKILNGNKVALQLSVIGSERRLTPMTETTILRVAREAVANALKHADPRSISVTLSYESRRVALTVVDDGRGADASRIEQARASGHWGLAGMRERATRLGGTFDMSSVAGSGTSVVIALPAESLQ